MQIPSDLALGPQPLGTCLSQQANQEAGSLAHSVVFVFCEGVVLEADQASAFLNIDSILVGGTSRASETCTACSAYYPPFTNIARGIVFVEELLSEGLHKIAAFDCTK